MQANYVRQAGPANFRTFPNHHFFVRVYRHSAVSYYLYTYHPQRTWPLIINSKICAALLNRKTSFLSSPEWLSTPWELHPKSPFDLLLDILVFLPSLFSRADRIFPHDPTIQRRLMAQDLLSNCLSLERQLAAWHATVDPGSSASNSSSPTTSSLFWIQDCSPGGGGSGGGLSEAQIPFADTFAFPSAMSAVTAVYHWTSLVLLYPCIERLHSTIFHRVMDAFPQAEPALPRHLRIDPNAYSAHKVRELAANVCRSLDFALHATVQPDLLVVPLYVVQEFYGGINESAGDGQLEIMWCEGFRARLLAKGSDIADVVRGRRWRDLAAW